MVATLSPRFYRLVERARDGLDRERRLRALAPLEQEMELRLRAYWLMEATRFLSAFRAEDWRRVTGLREAGEEFSFDFVLADTQANLAPQAEKAFRGVATATSRGAKAVADDLAVNVSLDVKHPEAVRYARERAAERVTAINKTTRRYIATEIRKGIANGDSYERVARRITARYAEFGAPSPLRHIRSRAELVAVTEMGDAYAWGTMHEAREQRDLLGLPLEKHWLTTGDARVDDIICRPNESAGWIDLEELFPSGHDRPTGHPGCRCDVQTRRAEH